MSRPAKPAANKKAQPEPAPAAPAPPLPRAAWVLLVALAAGILVALVSYPIYDTDLWQHLLVGKVIWTTHSIPHTQLWTWPTHGAPDVLPSWLFRALLYPFWTVGGLAGITAWRWLTTLIAFGFLWAASRASGARGPWALVALVWCAMLYRYRSQARPETFVAVLVAAQMWLLERRRAQGVTPGRIDPAWFVVPIALVWANAHISYYIGLFLTAAYWLAAVVPSKAPRPPQAPRVLFMVGLASAAVSFLNPFGWRALWQPFEYFLVWRHEPIYKIIGELAPIDWGAYPGDLLPAWFAALGALALWSLWRKRFDVVQWLVLAAFVPQALGTQRFLGYLAVLVAPFFARDLDAWCASLRGRFLGQPAARVALVAVTMSLLAVSAMQPPALRPRVGFVWNEFPVRACDWIEAHGVRGKAFNAFGYGGYMLYRFYPDPGRLPFMDIHQAGTTTDRYLAAHALQTQQAWADLDSERHFDYVLMPHRQYTGQHLLDFLDADTTWALVFVDDAAALYLRRSGPLGPLAQREGYRLLGAGDQKLAQLGARTFADSALRAQATRELQRTFDSSPWHGGAANLLANVAFAEGRWADARRLLVEARATDPSLPGLSERLGLAAFYGGHPDSALIDYRREAHDAPGSKTVDFRMGQAYALLGKRAEARAAYERALKADPANVEARDSLAMTR
jgi:hypothetical protein